MTAPADTAAGRIRAFLDARPERDDYESSDIILTEPDPNPGAGRRWLHLTRADLRAVLAEREQLAARVAEMEAQRDARSASVPVPVLRQAWRNGWTDRANAMRQTIADTNEQRNAYERAFARYMSEDPAEDDKDPYRPLDGPGDPAAEDNEPTMAEAILAVLGIRVASVKGYLR